MKVADALLYTSLQIVAKFCLGQYRLAQVLLGVIFCPVSNFDMVRLT